MTHRQIQRSRARGYRLWRARNVRALGWHRRWEVEAYLRLVAWRGHTNELAREIWQAKHGVFA